MGPFDMQSKHLAWFPSRVQMINTKYPHQSNIPLPRDTACGELATHPMITIIQCKNFRSFPIGMLVIIAPF